MRNKSNIAIILTLACVFAVPVTLAKPHWGKKLSRVIYRVKEEQWAVTNSAQVTVNINANLSTAGLSKARQEIMTKLNKIAAGSWHITAFKRTKDSSGLERVSVSAQTRVPENALANLRTKAASASRPGESYTIKDIDFSPTLAQFQAVKAQLRHKIYQDINAEIKRLNRIYPNQGYSVKSINFLPSAKYNPWRRQIRSMAMNAYVRTKTPNLAVSDKVQLSALVVLSTKSAARANNS